MPNGNVFEKLLKDWQSKAETYLTKLKGFGTEAEELEGRLQRLQQQPKEEFAQQVRGNMPSWMLPTWEIGLVQQPLASAEYKGIKERLGAITAEMDISNYFATLYIAIPSILQLNKSITAEGGVPDIELTSVDDILRELPPPPDASATELADMKDTINTMLEAVEEGEPPEAGEIPPELAELLPPLKAPTAVSAPLSLQRLTVDEILKAVVLPKVPRPIMSESEWQELFNQLYPEYADMDRVEAMKAQAREILAESKLYNEQMGMTRRAIAEMPAYELTDFLKEMAVMPGVALLEVARKYFETTSQPMAALLYKNFIPDIEHLYQQNRATSDSDWQALQKSWEEWDAPGSGVPEFLLKYMVMETVTDPLTWLAIFTVGTSMMAGMTGRFARFAVIMNKTTRVIFAPFEAPFAGVKWIIGKLPKTITQRATIAANWGGQWGKVALERFAGKGKLVSKGMTMKDWDLIAKRSIRYAFDNPQAADELAHFGRALLQHKPLDQGTILRWSDRLGARLTEEQVTREMVGGINAIFESIFQKFGSKGGKLMTTNEGAGRLLEIFGLSGGKPELRKTAEALLHGRANNIVREARAFARLDIPHKALQAMVKRNFRYSVAAMEQAEWFKQAGRIQSFVAGAEVKVAAVWRKYVEDTIVRPMAESYLTFGMYGPMNVIEDLWRSVLGGVSPRRMDVPRFAAISKNLRVDSNLLDPNLGVSEMLGKMGRRGAEDEWNNWVLQLAMVGQKDWADKLYTGLVRLPGGFGMDLRRNFVGQKYLVLFKEMGGERVEAIARAEGRLPQLADKKLARELRQAVYDAKTTLDLDAVRGVKDTFTRKSIYRKEVQGILKEHPDLPNSVRDLILESYDDGILYSEGIKSVNKTMRGANDKLVEEYLRGAELATRQFQSLTEELTKFEVRNPEEMAHLMLNLNIASQIYGDTPKQIMARATIRSRGLPLEARRAQFDKVYDDILEFMEKAGGNLEELLAKVRTDIGTNAFNKDYVVKSQRLFDLLESKRSLADKFRQENMAWRREWFAGVERKDMTSEWWDGTFRNLDQQYYDFDLSMVDLDATISEVIGSVDAAAGIKPFSRKIIVEDVLAPQDIASLIGCTGDDLSRGILDNLSLVYDRPRFIKYVTGKAKISGSTGFTDKAVGDAYDQIVRGLKVNPDAVDWMTRKQIQVKAVREDLHYLHHSKLLPDNEVAEIGRYVDESANAVERLIYGEVPSPLVAKVISTKYYRGLTPKPGAEHRTSVYFTRSKKEASYYGTEVSEVWVNPKNPMQAETAVDAAEKLGVSKEYDRLVAASPVAADDIIAEAAKKRGYDSIIRREGDWVQVIDKSIISTSPPTIPTKALKPEYANLDELRQQAMDEANKWYYKEYTDYTNANAFDTIMKAIYPFWRYESQRWFWLPRSFVRHPGTFTAFERWQDNTDYGYIPIAGTSVEINPFRGTIYGTLSTRLSRRDYPEYYDAYEGATGLLEFNDFLTRWGFYPGAHIGIPLALFGGMEPQMGETIPAIWKSPLMIAQAADPDNEFIKLLTDHVFGERFRNYMIMREVTARGYDASVINAKRNAGKELTDEEQSVWDESRRTVGALSLLFEQAGLLRLRHPEQRRMYDVVTQYIEEKYGYTADQQKWLRMHGYRIWDRVGGQSPEDQMFLEELDYWKWQTLASTLYPGKQQLVADRLTLDWDEIERYTETQKEQILAAEREVLTGGLSAKDYVGKVSDLYSKRRDFIDHKQEENTLLRLEERRKYYEEQGIPVPVLHPLKELMNLYFDIEVKEMRDPETGELLKDWDTFWAERTAIEGAVPDQWKAEWEVFLSKNQTPLEAVRREVNEQYLSKYNQVWSKVFSNYSEEDQKLIKEYLYLERMRQDFARQEIIKGTVMADGRKLISAFRSDVSEARQALRYANPYLDAWLNFWGRVSSFQTPEAEEAYRTIAGTIGKRL